MNQSNSVYHRLTSVATVKWIGLSLGILLPLIYFMLYHYAGVGHVPPLPGLAIACGLASVGFLMAILYKKVDQQLNQLPEPPYYIINKLNGRCIELDEDGSHESCQAVLHRLTAEFGGQYVEHMDAGPRPHSDKDKGYWKIHMLEQEFFVMRDRGYGLCIWGPKPPADIQPFMRVAKFFQAKEFRTWQQKLVSFFRGRGPHGSVTSPKRSLGEVESSP